MRGVLVPLLCALLLAGCGQEDQDRLRADVEARVERVQARAEKLRDRIAARVKEVLEDLEKAVPSAPEGSFGPRARGRTEVGEIERFLTDIIEDVDRYWTRTLAASDLREPRVSYVWVAPGERVVSGCRAVADDDAAFYCPADDTIYFSQVLAARFYGAVGDFGVAYVVAHEYAHNVQNELGQLSANGRTSSKPFELQADCMAGLWGNSAYNAGRFDEADVEEAVRTAYAVGDFDYGNPNHHGTPDERRAAWLVGFRSGDPADCSQFGA
jgi:predicted metalloprotease